MNNLMNEQMKEVAMRETQKKEAFKDMQVQLEIKAQKKREEEELKKLEN